MVNSVICVGKVAKDIEQLENGEYLLTISVPRSFKNENGEYEVDNIPAIIWEGIASNVKEYLHIKDTVGIRGRLQVIDNQLCLIAEKITFLSAKKEEE